jgi:uncharacterized repeat protein (TIGR03803 family)
MPISTEDAMTYFGPFKHFARRFAPAVAAAGVGVFVPYSGPAAQFTRLHGFCASTNCLDGEYPNPVAMDGSGSLYGTTYSGGKYGKGVVFKLVPNADTGKYKEYILHNFGKLAGSKDGANPSGRLVLDADGNLYGTTVSGGKGANGTIYKLTHGTGGWSFKLLYSFCTHFNGHECPDGAEPSDGLTYSGQGSGSPWNESSPLFGTAAGGAANGNGAVFQLAFDGSLVNYAVIHQFSSGELPGGLAVDGAGNVFGVTAFGGANQDAGLLFKLANGTWKATVLHNFCAAANCLDGKEPYGQLLVDGSGDIFGTTTLGGSDPSGACVTAGGCGVVFEHASSGAYSVLYNFCSLANCADGANPTAGVLRDSAGHLFGATTTNGDTGNLAGTVYELSHDSGSWVQTVLHAFCFESFNDCPDGSGEGDLAMDPAGNLFGNAIRSGPNMDGGTVFEISP